MARRDQPGPGMLPSWRRLLAELAVPVLLVLATLAAFQPLVQGNPPLARDNNVHLYRAWQAEDLLRSGDLFGWSDAEYAGHPPMLVYHCGGDLLVFGIRQLTGADLGKAYAWAVLAAILIVVLATYSVGRANFSIAAGGVAALLALVDPGDVWTGGRSSTLGVGLWETSVACALVVAGLGLVPGCVRRGPGWTAAACGALLGVAVLFTPLSLVMLAVSLPAWALAFLAARPRPRLRDVVRPLPVVVLSALAICGFWLVPFLTTSIYRSVPGVPPSTSAEVWAHVMDGTLLVSPALFTGIALCGLGMLLGRRDPFSLFVALYVPLVLFGTTAEVVGLLAPAGRSVDALMLPRLVGPVRLLCFVAFGYAVAAVARGAGRTLGRGWGRAGAVVLALLLGSMARPGLQAVLDVLHQPLPVGLEAGERQDLDRALDAAAPLVGTEGRLALYEEPHAPCGEVMLGPVALRGMKVHLMKEYPASMFAGRFFAGDPEPLGRLGVTALLSNGPPPLDLAALPRVGRFGQFELRRVQPRPRAWLDGPGHTRVVRWTREEIAVEVTGSRPGDHLDLMLTWHGQWRQADGQPTEPFQWKVRSDPQHFAWLSRLPARDGLVVLRYVAGPEQHVGLGVSLACLLGLVLMLRRRAARQG